ncbi:hypothetical protein F5984_19855 [Rudanella paleaurantiibacter]|uniref:Tape measure protein n=1 Tax=Rudanella paleaurantiibacter TaxID=2614655 RepID=A0A7J5TV30_9BACT|nr:hypothetical protein [Rudanella paleaurantiibacter]KAB7728012.1 hypothetical protein F5984_19855 [Rudanella paleaurantiibacter]
MAINLNEEATLTLKGNTRDFSNEITQLETKAKSLKQTLKEIETTGTGKGSEEWKKYKAELAGVNTELGKTRKEVDLSKLTYGQLSTLVKQLNRDLKGLVPGTEDFVKATNRLNEAKARLSDVDKQVKAINKESTAMGEPTRWQRIGNGIGIMSKAFAAFFALEIVGYIIGIGRAIFETTGKFERYEKVLTNALGSEKAAKQSMEAIKKMAASTAFSVDELTDGYVKLVNRGMKPSQKEMMAMADLAASQGKKFDELVEAALDAQTGEFERLKEFGIRASKSGDQVTLSFKGMNQVVKNTPEAIQGALTKFGEMKGVAGQNAEMMKTLEGQLSNVGDSFDSLKVAVGDKLRPVFVGTLSVFGMATQWLGKIVEASDPVIAVFDDLFDAVGGLVSSFLSMIRSVFPQTISGSNALGLAMKGIGLVLRALLVPIQIGISAMMEFYQIMTGVIYAGKALVKVLAGDFGGAVSSFEQSKKAFGSVGDAAKANFDKMKKGWQEAMVDTPNKTAVEAVFAAKDTEKKRQEGMTEEQKKAADKRAKEAEKQRKKEEKDHQKHLDEVQKANQKALEDLAKLEADAHIASIKDEMQREFAKLMAKRDLDAEEIGRGIQDQKIKDQQIANLDKKLQEDIARVHAEFAEKKKKKDEEVAQKRLEVEKNIIAQEQQAENALFDWREMMAKNNATKLAQVHKERSDKQYELTLSRLKAEEAAEVAKARREIADQEQLDRAITAIEARYHNERLVQEKKHADEVDKINRDLQEKKKAAWSNAGNAFSALLKGDLSAFTEYASKIVQGEQQAWQKRLGENQEKYAAVAQMATAAVQFLNQLEQQKAERAIAAARKERDEKVALLNDRLAAEKAAQDAAEAEKQRVTQESNDKIQAIKSAAESNISSLEQQYRQLSSSEEKAKLNEQLAGYKENAEGKKEAAKQAAQEAIDAAELEAKQSIEAAQKAEKAAIKAAQNEKDGKIDAAEAARDAEIEAIKKRTDVDSETRKKMLAEAQDRFEKEKKMAQDEAQLKIDQAKDTAKAQTDLAKDTAKTKIELAKDQQEAELKAIEAIQKGDEKAAKEILANAKKDAQEKIRLAKEEAEKKIDEAEREKREKLKKVEAEKQARIQNQKELNRSIESENAKAKQKEADAKRKAWEAQKKADIASALIAGALATLKALASGPFPLNIVFAAATAVMTGVQVAMIKRQPAPAFKQGGFLAQGPAHGSSYGKGGIALIRRDSGQEVGEMEGDEAIISKEQTQANWPIISRMFSNARTPGRSRQPVYRDAAGRRAFQAGGLLEPLAYGQMYLFGSKAKKAAKKAEEEAAQAAAEQEAASFDASGAGDYSAGGEGDVEGMADAKAAGEEAKKQGQEQLKLLGEIRDAIKQSDTGMAIANLESSLLRALNDGFMSQRQAIALMALNTARALEQVEDTTSTGLAKLDQTITDSMTGLARSLALALMRSTNQQGSDSEKLVEEIRASATKISDELTRALEANATKTSSAVNSARLTNALAVTNLTLKLVEGFDRMGTDSLRELDRLGNRIETSDQALADQLELAVQKASTNSLRGMEALGKMTSKSLDDLSKATTKSLDALSDDVVKELKTLNRDTSKALDSLSIDVTQALDLLNRDTSNMLVDLRDRTERALDDSATRTTRSVDAMAGEVRALKGSINAVEGAVYQVRGAVQGVEGAVYGTNQAGRLDALIAGISTFGSTK